MAINPGAPLLQSPYRNLDRAIEPRPGGRSIKGGGTNPTSSVSTFPGRG